MSLHGFTQNLKWELTELQEATDLCIEKPKLKWCKWANNNAYEIVWEFGINTNVNMKYGTVDENFMTNFKTDMDAL
jgi:hypothetical protein